MSNEFKNNHYVPEWYQKRFLPLEDKNKELFYLDLNPRKFFDSKGGVHTDRPVRRLGFSHCFAEEEFTSFP